ncbi:MAG: polysaccharide biosynthesis C-terminal domain-containing protein [Defluviitaleaceae bacterium]|nr:polysaccharide biosynthesis C-terminal domain-containing protein [Defluviitaleaceae bacterium]
MNQNNNSTNASTNTSTFLTVFSVAGITAVVRLLTVFSMQLYMARYGATDPKLNIFSYALMLPNTVFTSVGTVLTTAVVPIYAALIAKKSEMQAKKFLDDIISISSLFILALVLIGTFAAPFLAGIAVQDSPELVEYAIFSIRVLMPVMFAYGLSFIFQGILQSHGKFKLVAAVSAPTAIITIAYLFLWGDRFGVTGLLYATLIGLVSQAALLLPAVLKTGYRFKLSFDFKSDHIKACGRLVLPVLLGVGAYQINTLYNSTVAMRLESTTIIHFVQNIVIMSVLTFVFSIAAVYFPRFSVLWDSDDIVGFKKSLSDVMSVLIFLLLPMSFGFIAVRFNLLNLLTYHGQVTMDEVLISANLLALYSIGILALGFKEVFDRAFYAQKNAKISGRVGVLIMGLNVALNLALIQFFGVYSLPLSFAISASIGTATLVFIMRRKLETFGGGTSALVLRCFIASVCMFAVLAVFIPFFDGFFDNSIADRFIRLFVPVLAGVAVYFGVAAMIGVKQARIPFVFGHNQVRKIILKFKRS